MSKMSPYKQSDSNLEVVKLSPKLALVNEVDNWVGGHLREKSNVVLLGARELGRQVEKW